MLEFCYITGENIPAEKMEGKKNVIMRMLRYEDLSHLLLSPGLIGDPSAGGICLMPRTSKTP